jgi:PAS domain S-box-containing protein
MKKTGHELFLLAVDLSQLNSKEEILKVFSERIESVFPNLKFISHSVNEKVTERKIAICTSLKSYGFITFIHGWEKDSATFELIQNLCRMVAVLLEKAEQVESKKTDAALKESYSKYLAVFESTGSATLLVEEDTTISLANQECLSLTGYSREELIGQKWTKYVEKESLEQMIKNHNLRRMDPAMAPKKYEVKLLNKKGEIRYALLDIGMVKETGQSIVSIIDITDRIVAEQALMTKADELERFNRLMLGREIRMIELKKEINELLKKSGKNEKYKIHG